MSADFSWSSMVMEWAFLLTSSVSSLFCSLSLATCASALGSLAAGPLAWPGPTACPVRSHHERRVLVLLPLTRFILRGKDMSEAMRQLRCWFTSWIRAFWKSSRSLRARSQTEVTEDEVPWCRV